MARSNPPVLLSGGNPQIRKGDSDAPVAACIPALPGWKRQLGERLHALVVATITDVQTTVKWSSPLHGIAGEGWTLSLHASKSNLKPLLVSWHLAHPAPVRCQQDGGHALRRPLRGGPDRRAQLADRVRQAARLPGFLARQ